MCGWEGVGVCWVVLETIFCRSLTLCSWPDSEPTKLLHTPNKTLGGEGSTDRLNSCRKVPLQVNIFRQRHLVFLSISLIFLQYQLNRPHTAFLFFQINYLLVKFMHINHITKFTYSLTGTRSNSAQTLRNVPVHVTGLLFFTKAAEMLPKVGNIT